jgi:hypothetical protein
MARKRILEKAEVDEKFEVISDDEIEQSQDDSDCE